MFEEDGKDVKMTIFQGSTISFSVTLSPESGEDPPGAMTDAIMELRRKATDSATVARFDTDSGVTLDNTDENARKATFAMSAEDSAALPIVSGVWSIKLNQGGGLYRIESGSFEIKPQITQESAE